MSQRLPPTRPAWVSDEIFPFESNFFTTPSGHEMHFVDEGAGEPIIFLHGNPTWSFEFRHLVKDLRTQYRCIAPDHIGFGLSSRSHQHADYRPEAHASAVAALLDHLDVQDATLYLVDWGGPIGLDFARKHPDRVRRIIITNTWCWPVARDPHYVLFSFFMSSRLGKYLIKRHNMFVNRVLPMAVAQKEILTAQVMAHYRNAQPTPEARAACAAFPGHIIGATDWLQSLWDDRAAFTAKPALVFWGFKDIAFREKELNRWKAELADFEVHEFKDCGHFLAEEAPDRMLPALHAFMERAR